MPREKSPKQLALELFGPPSPEEAARLWGRMSATRARAYALGGGQCLPELPPPEQDVSLRYAAEDAARRARTRARRQRNKNGKGPRRACNLKSDAAKDAKER